MSQRIQITVDDELMKTIQTQATAMGLSVSSFSRLALKTSLSKNGVMVQALEDLQHGEVEQLSFDQFKKQVDNL